MAQHSTSGKRRALIVEDEFLIAVDLETILRGLGFDVCGLASNPSEAIFASDEQPARRCFDGCLSRRRLSGDKSGQMASRGMRNTSLVCHRAQ